jgi:hypothetical protein
MVPAVVTAVVIVVNICLCFEELKKWVGNTYALVNIYINGYLRVSSRTDRT